MDTKYLSIPREEFVLAYDNPDYAFLIYVKPGQGELEYLSWSSAKNLLMRYFPNLVVEFERNANGLLTFKLENNLRKEAKDRFEQLIAEKQELLKEEKDWKKEKNLKKEIAEYSDQLYYDNRGVAVMPYLVDVTTGLRTPSLLFPVMSNTNDAIYNPDIRDINDSCMRAAVKVIALNTGLALRLFTREDVGKSSTTESDKFKKIDEIVKCSAILGKLVDKTVVNFGSSMPMLNKVANDLKKEIEIKKEERAKKSQ
jgi:hypothetical protein